MNRSPSLRLASSLALAAFASALAACGPPPSAPLPPVVAPPLPPSPAVQPPPPLAEVRWAPTASDAESVTLGGSVGDGAAAVEAVVVSVSCPTEKIGRGEVIGDRASLYLDASEVALAIQCHGLRVSVARGAQKTTTVVPFDVAMPLAPDVSGGIGVSRTTKNPDLVLAIPGSSPSSRLTIGKDVYVARAVTGGNAEFVVPILALTRAALHHLHAVATTGFKPIEYIPELSVAGQTVTGAPAPAPP